MGRKTDSRLLPYVGVNGLTWVFVEFSSQGADRAFALNFRERRLALEMPQSSAAAQMVLFGFDFHTSTIGKIERLERRVTIAEALAMADIVDASLETLIGRDPSEITMQRVLGAGRSLTSRMQRVAQELADAKSLARDLYNAAETYDESVDPARDPEFETGQGAHAQPYFADLIKLVGAVQVDFAKLRPYLDRYELEYPPDGDANG